MKEPSFPIREIREIRGEKSSGKQMILTEAVRSTQSLCFLRALLFKKFC